MDYSKSWTSPGQDYFREGMSNKDLLRSKRPKEKTPYVGNVDGGWDVMKADGTMIKAFGRNGEKAAKAYLKKNFKKLSK